MGLPGPAVGRRAGEIGLDEKHGEASVHDQFDVTLEDADLLGEVELTTNLIIAASEADDHLSDAEIDEILGVVPAPRSES